MRRRRRSRRSSSARHRAFSRSYMASNSRVVRSHSARWARRSSGFIFPLIFFLFEQTIELRVDRHQHANDAIDGLAIERRLLATPHLDIVVTRLPSRKMSEVD